MSGRTGGQANGRTLYRALVLLLCACAPVRLCAQGPAGLRPVSDTTPAPLRPSVPPLVHYGKWVTLGGSIALGVAAAQRHSDANSAYNTLRTTCFMTPSSCALVNGHYTDPASEALYQETRRLDHEAARYLIGAETLFAASAAGFVWELIESHPRTRNIPFHPAVEPTPAATRVTLSIRF